MNFCIIARKMRQKKYIMCVVVTSKYEWCQRETTQRKIPRETYRGKNILREDIVCQFMNMYALNAGMKKK